MSDKPTLRQLYDKAVQKLDECRLGEALLLLQSVADAIGDWQLLDEVADVASSYDLLLYYMRQGNNDPDRERQHTNFIARCYAIADKAMLTMLRRRKNSANAVRNVGEILKDIENIGLKNITSHLKDEDLRHHVELYAELYETLCRVPQWNDENVAQAQEIIDSALVSVNDKVVATSGMFVNCLIAFDPKKVIFFADNYLTATDEQLRARMLVALALTLHTYRRRLFAYPQLSERIEKMCANTRFSSDLATLQMHVIESLSTLEVNRQMREEIIPAMLKNKNFNPTKFGIDKMKEISESNPEWKDFEQQVGKLAELEAGGADIYYSTFSALKRYSFFQCAANWFYPFDRSHPLLPPQIRQVSTSGIAGALLKSNTLCDSDKYSFCLLTAQMGEDQLKMLVSQLPDIENNDTGTITTFETESRNYLRNIFRFFYLCNDSIKPTNPFENEISLLDCPAFRTAFDEKSLIDRISSLAMKKRKYDMAFAYLELNDTTENVDAETYQKIGFCLQMEKKYFEAIAAYEKANALDGNSKWTLQHLAQTNRLVGNYKDALGYYTLLAVKNSADAKIAFRCGECLVHLEQYDAALRDFFKAEYLNPSMTAALRAIAWCSVLTGDMAQARKYYEKLLAIEAASDDFIGAGHTAWMDGDIKTAAGYYIHACETLKPTEFRDKFYSDAETLKTHGISDNDMLLMYDLVTRNRK